MKLSRNDLCHCGSGNKYKKCCLPSDEQQKIVTRKIRKPQQVVTKDTSVANDAIIATHTGEFVLPVRLCYRVYDKQTLHNKIFRNMKCMSFDADNDRWTWLFEHEAKNLSFKYKYNDIPKNLRPIVIGSFFTDNDDEMHLDVRSHERAEHAIVFFDKYIDRSVAEVTHAIVLNRLITETEIELSKDFDNYFKNVEIVDKAKEFEELMENAKKQYKDKNGLRDYMINLMEIDSTRIIDDVEKIRLNYYEDGINPFRFSLKIKRIVAINKFNGEEVTEGDIYKIIANTFGEAS